MGVTIYHNPQCSTSRNALGLIRNAGLEPQIVLYLETPPSRQDLEDLARRAGVAPAALFRAKESLAKELGLTAQSPSELLLDAMAQHPVLIERPIIDGETGVAVARPVQKTLDVLCTAQKGAFETEKGVRIVDENGARVV